ncbi:MAG: hypothetical protein J0M04_24670 [Verrucomicrobia bacterium]|nr:hypothetical protein [Verrucomicrobiota bacterium]
MKASVAFGQIIPMSALAAIGIPAAALLVVIGVAIWRLRRRAKMPDTMDDQATARASDDSIRPAGIPALEPVAVDTPERLSAIAQRVSDPDLREFLTEIARSIGEIVPDSRAQASDSFVEEMLDRHDDLRAILRKRTGDEAEAIGGFREAIVRVLADCGVELVQSDTWNPALQRAIAKNPVAGTAAPTITDFGSTGYFRHGTLRRKQEVVLAIPSSDPKPPTNS